MSVPAKATGVWWPSEEYGFAVLSPCFLSEMALPGVAIGPAHAAMRPHARTLNCVESSKPAPC